ncbi:MAG: hypothetical protein HPY53_01575 [Brevinematales bacterium]|nr:hypothetical protein [Brevinematales bacterium]
MVKIVIQYNERRKRNLEFITFWKGKNVNYKVEMILAQYDGQYVGSACTDLALCGYGSYPDEQNQRFPTREACIEYLAMNIRDYLKGNGDKLAPIALKAFNLAYNDYTEPKLFA